MTRRRLIIALALWLQAALPAGLAAPEFQGMSYTSFGQNALATSGSDLSIANMAAVGVDTVALNFWWFQDTVSSNTMSEDFTRYSSTISSIEHAIDEIHSLGMKVLLKPMLDVKSPPDTWRAYINPSDPDAWFANYTNFLGTFADIAEAKGVELFSIGCEMNNMENPVHNARWTNTINNVRSRYSGPLTYSANWGPAGDPDGGGPLVNAGGGYQAVPWWDQLDYIGIDAYFPIAANGNFDATPAELTAGANTVANTIESWRNANHPSKQVLFTEIGYRSLDGAAQAPWGQDFGGGVDVQEQADAYEAVLTTMSARSWWDGAFWWSWETNPYVGGPSDSGFTPHGKPAEDVLAGHYGGTPAEFHGVPSQTLYSFESGLEGWQVASFSSFPASVAQGTVGATDGDHSLAVSQTVTNPNANHFSWNARVPLADDALAAVAGALLDDPANYQLEFDVTYSTAAIAQGSVSWLNASVAINNDAGWSQVNDLAPTNGHTNQTIHVSVPLTSWTNLSPDSPWYEIILAMNGDWAPGSATVFFDNFQLVNLDAPLTGDYNEDGYVDAADYTVWRNALDTQDLRADGNLNGVVDTGDYKWWRANYGRSLFGGGGGLGATVPEPNPLVLGLLAAIFTFFSRPAGTVRNYLLSSCSSALPSTCRRSAADGRSAHHVLR